MEQEERAGTGKATRIASIIVVTVAAALAVGLLLGVGLSKGNGGLGRPVLIDAPDVSVDIWNYKFFPDNAVIRAGSLVTWTNFDPVSHNATSGRGDWEMPLLVQDQIWTISFDTPGVYEYYCTVHPFMKGRIVVS